MDRETKIVRAIRNAIGTISCGEAYFIPIHFDLLETQDFADGVPSPSFGMGNLDYEDGSVRFVSEMVRCHTRLILDGGGIHAAIFLHTPHEFTVMSAITPSR